jgi:hypothetical protein
MRKLFLLAAFALAGCANQAGTAPQPANYTAMQQLIVTDAPIVTIAANQYAASPLASASAKAAIAKAEADMNTYLPALTASSPPTTFTAILSDMEILIGLPGGVPGVSSKTQADISTAVSLALTGAQLAATLAPLF